MRIILASCFLFLASFAMGQEAVPNEFIVIMEPGFRTQDFRLQAGEELVRSYPSIGGMLVRTAGHGLATLERRGVELVEPNYIFRTQDTQINATWGLDRIDARAGLDGNYNFTETGRGVTAYVIDTGIMSSHPDLSGKVQPGFSSVGGGTEDCNGHGTHVAGTIGGIAFGVAKNVALVPVRVLGCDGSGSSDSVIRGIEFVAQTARLPAVANMSLGSSRADAVNRAVSAAIARGVVFAVAAGNSSADACNFSPASVPEAITVAASDERDGSAGFTNHGPCVDLYAPGVNIVSAGLGGGSASLSGTSMASPHVAGAIARLLEKNPGLAPSQVEKALLEKATSGAIRAIPGSTRNFLLFTDLVDGSTPPGPQPGPKPQPDVPKECEMPGMCLTFDGSLTTAGKYYDAFPPLAINYGRPIDILVTADADLDIYLYHSTDNGQSWTEVSKAATVGKTERLIFQVKARGVYSWVVLLRFAGTSGSYRMTFVK